MSLPGVCCCAISRTRVVCAGHWFVSGAMRPYDPLLTFLQARVWQKLLDDVFGSDSDSDSDVDVAKIILVCAEGVKVAVPLDHAMRCKVLADLLGDLPIAEDEVTPQVPVTALTVRLPLRVGLATSPRVL